MDKNLGKYLAKGTYIFLSDRVVKYIGNNGCDILFCVFWLDKK
ncbi:MAG: hypothetical protein K0R69_2757 [Clostridia bacterium]|nr:hypothetical protein [Clostridia bacterium]